MSARTLKTRTTTVTLFQGDDHDRIDELRRAAETAVMLAASREDGEPKRLNEDPRVIEAAAEYDAFLEGAIERGVQIELHALPRKTWRTLVAEHPPRMVEVTEGNETREVPHDEDAAFGFNYEALGDALVPLSMDPNEFPNAQEFVDELSDGDFSRLYSAAVGLNQSMGPDPKARMSSHLARTSDETSKSPERLG